MMRYGYGMMGYGPGYGYGYAIEHILSIIFWVVLIILLLTVIRRANMRNRWMGRGMMGGTDALDILKERYAKGEINKEEFEAKKKDLMS